MVVGILGVTLKLILESEPDKVNADPPTKHTIDHGDVLAIVWGNFTAEWREPLKFLKNHTLESKTANRA